MNHLRDRKGRGSKRVLSKKDQDRINELVKHRLPLLEQKLRTDQCKIQDMLVTEQFHTRIKVMIALFCRPKKEIEKEKHREEDSEIPILREQSLRKLESACESVELEAAACRRIAEMVKAGQTNFVTTPNRNVFTYSTEDVERLEVVIEKLFDMSNRVLDEVCDQRSFVARSEYAGSDKIIH